MLVPPELALTPPTRLAISYADPKFRRSLRLLMQIDQRLSDIVAKAREPLIGQIKLAWWREGFTSDPASRPKGEPLFEALTENGDDIPVYALESLVSAWELLIGEDDWTPALVAKHAKLRAEAVFGTYADWVGAPTGIREIGPSWASLSLAEAFPGRLLQAQLPAVPSLPKARRLRPLTILALSVYAVSGPRLIWHALTGR